jgi:hypothetical protein
MAIIVKVFINSRLIIDTHACRIAGNPHQECTYEDQDGEHFKHYYDDGAEQLAIKLLERWEVKHKK